MKRQFVILIVFLARHSIWFLFHSDRLDRGIDDVIRRDGIPSSANTLRRWQDAMQVKMMKRQQILDLYFMDARSKLIDLAAFLDRVDRADGEPDFRLRAFRKALAELNREKPDRAESVLLAFSDPTNEPAPSASTKAACGAWPETA